jgi:hypothetical protein
MTLELAAVSVVLVAITALLQSVSLRIHLLLPKLYPLSNNEVEPASIDGQFDNMSGRAVF